MNTTTLSILLLLFASTLCGCSSHTQQENKEIDSLETVEHLIPSDSSGTQLLDDSPSHEGPDSLTIEAEFLGYHLGDASHFIFRDTKGKSWDFADYQSSEFMFERGLSNEEVNEDNQGWGSNEELLGVWFQIKMSYKEQQVYIDGPIGQVAIIEDIKRIESKQSVYNDGSGISLVIDELKQTPAYFHHKSEFSPDSLVKLELVPIDPSGNGVKVQFDEVHHELNRIFTAPNEYYWSESGKYVILNNIDFYSNAGTSELYLLNPKTGSSIRLGMEMIFRNVDIGDREMVVIKNINWIDNHSFTITGHAQYLGSSGHPGIDYNRREKLGKNFGNSNDLVPVPNRIYKIISDEYTQLLASNIPEPKNFPLKEYTPTEAEESREVQHYICYSGLMNDQMTKVWVSFDEKSKAIEIKYQGQSEALQLVHEKEELYNNGATSVDHYLEVVDGKIHGNYKLTHSGIWDYVSYIRARDLMEFNFTIIHDADPYGSTPCFK